MGVHWRVVSRQSTTFLCDVPTVDLSQDRTALSGKFAEDELKAGRELELQNMLNFDAFELVDELPPRKHAYDMVWVGEWRGDRVRSRLCMSVQGRGNPGRLVCGGTPDTFFIKYLLAKAANFKDFGILVIDISVAFMHARTDEEIYVKVPSGIKSSKYWRRKTAVNGTRKASKHWQECSSDKLVTNMLFQQNDINPCIYKRFCDDLDLEQHGDDFRVCGVTRGLAKLTEEFNRHLLVKKSEIVSLKPEHQRETHFLKRRISVDEFGWHVELDQRYVKSLLDAMAINHCKSMATPGSKGQEGNNATEKLDAKEHREFRSSAGICQYMTEQRFDIDCLQHEGKQERGSWTDHSLKAKVEANRALPQRTPTMCVELLLGGKLDDVIHVTVDADWAGNPKTRCSTSGGVLAAGPCFTVRHWSVTQATVSLSSAESEAKAITKGCIEALYVKHLLEHQTARTFKIEVWTDSSSAKAIIQRLGPGRRTKHLEVQTMWVQQLNKLGLISMNKLCTLENVADMMTKHVPRGVLDNLAGMMGYSVTGEETAKFQEYSSIEQSYWNQKLTTIEKVADLR